MGGAVLLPLSWLLRNCRCWHLPVSENLEIELVCRCMLSATMGLFLESNKYSSWCGTNYYDLSDDATTKDYDDI